MQSGCMYQIAESNDGALFYSDYQEIRQGKKIHHPTLEYQTGSIRNDFDFGQLLLFRNDSFQQVVAQMNTDYRFGSSLRIKVKYFAFRKNRTYTGNPLYRTAHRSAVIR